jgi:hypothetical protein
VLKKQAPFGPIDPIAGADAFWTPESRETSTKEKTSPNKSTLRRLVGGGAQARSSGLKRRNSGIGFDYQTRQEFAGTMGWPFVQPNALPNSSKFCTVPLTRQRPGE